MIGPLASGQLDVGGGAISAALFKNDPSAREAVIRALTSYTSLTDPDAYDRVVFQGIDPDGRLPMESLALDQEHFVRTGQQSHRIDLSQVLDMTYANEIGRAHV